MTALLASRTPVAPDDVTPPRLARGAWLVLTAALLGWMFDGAEMAVFSMVGRPALMDLLGTQDDALVGRWFAIITAVILVGAATGGVLFGWLGDRIGRVRAMTLSILAYALFTGLCGFATAAWQVGVLRFIAALGMGGEWSLGVALVMEVWPNRSRVFMAALIGAAANVGLLLVGLVGFGLVVFLDQVGAGLSGLGLAEPLVDALTRNKGWRLMMFLAMLPALLTLFIRMFVPESARWQKVRDEGTTAHWATADLLGVLVGLAGPALIIYLWAWDAHGLTFRLTGTVVGLLIAALGYSYPMVRFLQRQGVTGDHPWRRTLPHMLLGAGLSSVAILGSWGTVTWAVAWADQLTAGAAQAKEETQIWMSVGAIVGTLAGALVGQWLNRRPAFFLYCALSLAAVGNLFLLNDGYGPWFLVSTFFGGACVASFYGWLPLYLPELFHTSVRATGQGFAFNFGRMLAAVGILQAGNLMTFFTQDVEVAGLTVAKGYPATCTVMSLVYVVGMVIIWLAPETRGSELPD